MKTRNEQSTSVLLRGVTVLAAAIEILRRTGNSMGPTEIADEGVRVGLLTVPRGRTRAYLAQTVQSNLQRNATHDQESTRLVFRPSYGKYRARARAYKRS